jgi:DNA-binding HxlR family transcriptional regulator
MQANRRPGIDGGTNPGGLVLSTDYRSPCAVASALDVVGDKWTLVVLRMIFAGRHRYGEIAAMPEKISTNILADRLEKLECWGLVTKRPYQDNPIRHEYRLTAKGADLLPVLQALAAWAGRHIPDRWPPPAWFTEGAPEQFYPKDEG